MADSLFTRPKKAKAKPKAKGKPKTAAKKKRAAVEANHEPLRRGRPAKHTEDWSKITAVLFDRQVVYLDRLSADIRANTRATVTRAEILRGLIGFLEESKIDITGATSEEALTEILLGKVKK